MFCWKWLFWWFIQSLYNFSIFQTLHSICWKISLQTKIFNYSLSPLCCTNFQELKQNKNNLAKLDVNVFNRYVIVRFSIFNVLLKMTFLMLHSIALQLFYFLDFSFNMLKNIFTNKNFQLLAVLSELSKFSRTKAKQTIQWN